MVYASATRKAQQSLEMAPPFFYPRLARRTRPAILVSERSERNNTKSQVVVVVVRVVPVAVRATHVVIVVVKRAATEDAVHTSHSRRGVLTHGCTVARCQPFNNLLISATIFVACLYWPLDNHAQRSASRRYTRTLSSSIVAFCSAAVRFSPRILWASINTSYSVNEASKSRRVNVCRWAFGKWFVMGSIQLR